MYRSRKNLIASVVSCVLLGVLALGMIGVILQVFTPYKPSEWFTKDELVATNEEEMKAFLVEENVGKTVHYTGDTVKEVTLPFAVGDTISSAYFDSDMDMLAFLQSIDYEQGVDVDYDGEPAKFVVLVATNGYEIEDFATITDEENLATAIQEGALLLAFHCGLESEGQQFDYYFIASFTDDPYFAYVLTNGVVKDYYTPFPEGFNGGTIDDGKSFEISDINPILMSGEHLFLGVENGEYGESKVQYEYDCFYIIEQAEDGELRYVAKNK